MVSDTASVARGRRERVAAACGQRGAVFEREAAPGIHRVEDAFVNWYVVEDGDRLLVVDAGHPRSWHSLQSALRELGRRVDDVEAIVLTHGHFDHVGFARRAHRELGIPVFVPEDEVQLAQHPWDFEHERSRVRNALMHPGFVPVFLGMGAAGAVFVRGVDDPVAYAPAGVLDVPGSPQVIACPGHTHGHCALLFADRGALVAGDALVTFNPYTGGRGPQIVSRTATADSRQALESLDAIAATGAELVLTGHGPVWSGGAEAAAELARRAGPS